MMQRFSNEPHNDMRKMAFFYNFKLYEDVVSKGGLK
jgi:hypothetical protein